MYIYDDVFFWWHCVSLADLSEVVRNVTVYRLASKYLVDVGQPLFRPLDSGSGDEHCEDLTMTYLIDELRIKAGVVDGTSTRQLG